MSTARRDRYGEPDPDEPCGCDHGWIDRDADRPIPCTRCRPWLATAAVQRTIHGQERP